MDPTRGALPEPGGSFRQLWIKRVAGPDGPLWHAEAFDPNVIRAATLTLLVPPPGLDADRLAQATQAFLDEALALARFNHPALAAVWDFGVEQGHAYVVTAPRHGRTLRAWRGSVPIDDALLRGLLHLTFTALVLLHREHTIHGAISPERLLLDEHARPLLLPPERVRRVLGEPPGPYAAPEQVGADAGGPEGPWSDLYALGATLRFLITGADPPPAVQRLHDDPLTPLAALAPPGLDPDLLRLVDRLMAPRVGDRPPSADAALAALSGPSAHGAPERTLAAPGPVASPQPAPAEPARSSRSTLTGRLGDALASWWRGLRPTAAEPPADDPVWLGVRAPRRCAPRSEFTVHLAAYVQAARAAVQAQFDAAGEPDERRLLDVAPEGASRWRRGAPVTVRPGGRHFRFTPEERRFEWNGQHRLVGFTACAADDAPPSAVFELLVLIDTVPVAALPVQLAVGPGAGAAAPAQRAVRAPASAFASYASKDAQEVAGRLSTLVRWAPGLDIFQDCLDLRPNEDFKRQLAQQIGARELFLLFWSRHAATSPWVRWELETALAHKALEAILPLPLEDPALAPPPPELAHLHLRDRFMVAGQAFSRRP
ncbi:MAG: TIR domain-containing protein [Piscinibacter sp.]|uniref:TIR domain-containing protein n=1 Tax=Piscinibacter TaxID=1114981 RepID=UPI0013E40EA4|nr:MULTISPECIES: TIR domain-containing protein [Piscinibacter]MCW5666572.1 TIR domain-containing protein [Piscinibacter sp.]